MNTVRPVVILSAESTKISDDANNQRTTILESLLLDLNLAFNRALGVYNGNSEASFVVLVNSEEEIEALKGFAFKNFDQESILLQDANQEASLLFANGTSERLGRLTQVSEEIAKTHNNFTLMNGQYYITQKRF